MLPETPTLFHANCPITHLPVPLGLAHTLEATRAALAVPRRILGHRSSNRGQQTGCHMESAGRRYQVKQIQAQHRPGGKCDTCRLRHSTTCVIRGFGHTMQQSDAEACLKNTAYQANDSVDTLGGSSHPKPTLPADRSGCWPGQNHSSLPLAPPDNPPPHHNILALCFCLDPLNPNPPHPAYLAVTAGAVGALAAAGRKLWQRAHAAGRTLPRGAASQQLGAAGLLTLPVPGSHRQSTEAVTQ
jgi:hypothetical protein